MSIVVSRNPHCKAKVQWRYFPAFIGSGTLEIVNRAGKVDSYGLDERGSDEVHEGRSFRLIKCNTGRMIHCHVADVDTESTCECEDWKFGSRNGAYPHKCKHIEAMEGVIESGKLEEEDPAFANFLKITG